MTLIPSDPASLGFSADRLALIPAHIRAKYLDTGRMPHAALLMGRGDEIAHLSLQGEAAPGRALAEDTLYRIASMTKPLTSIALMQLVEQGKVALSEPVAKYIPEWKDLGVFVAGGGGVPFVSRPPARPMQVIDLLRHTSGLTYGFQERSPVDAYYRKERIDDFQSNRTIDEYLAALAEVPLLFDPGSAWNYGVSTDVCAALVQRISGQPFHDYLRDHILAPLGMDDTFFAVPADKAGRLADAHAFHPRDKMAFYDPGSAESRWTREPAFPSGGGGLVSSLPDYHRFCRALLNEGELDGARIIGRKTLELMTANHLPGGKDLTQLSSSLFSEAENAGVGFGLGFATTMDVAPTMIPGSAGDFYWGGMFSTAFFVDPAEEIIMIFMTQLMPSSAYPVRREIKTMLYAALD